MWLNIPLAPRMVLYGSLCCILQGRMSEKYMCPGTHTKQNFLRFRIVRDVKHALPKAFQWQGKYPYLYPYPYRSSIFTKFDWIIPSTAKK